MRWTGHVAYMGSVEAYTGFWWECLMGRDRLGDPGVDGRMILRWIFEKYEGNSISKLQIVIEKNRMEIMAYKQHLFFKTISIQI